MKYYQFKQFLLSQDYKLLLAKNIIHLKSNIPSCNCIIFYNTFHQVTPKQQTLQRINLDNNCKTTNSRWEVQWISLYARSSSFDMLVSEHSQYWYKNRDESDILGWFSIKQDYSLNSGPSNRMIWYSYTSKIFHIVCLRNFNLDEIKARSNRCKEHEGVHLRTPSLATSLITNRLDRPNRSVKDYTWIYL